MKRTLADIVANLPADYADIRYEENHKTRILYQGKQLKDVASYDTSGGHLRTYADGGRALASFSDPSAVEVVARSTCASAKTAGAHRDRPLRLVDAPSIEESFPVSPTRDPRAVPLR